MRPVRAWTASVLMAWAAPLPAQLASASTAALGMGENFTAAARALNSVAWNPAGLGLPGGELPSMTLLTVRGSNGIDPIGLSDLARFAGDVVPAAVKDDWIARIEAHGGQAGRGTVEATWAALHVGRFGAQLATTSSLSGAVSPGIARLVMFGNLDAVGEPQALDLDGSSFQLNAYSTAAASLAQPIELGASRLSIGVTAKYTWGHLLALGERSRGLASGGPPGIDLGFPVIQSRLNPDSLRLDSGRGMGVDVGAAWNSGPLTLAAVVRNAWSSFAWQVSELRYRPLAVHFDGASAGSNTESMPLARAPQTVLERVENLRFHPVYAAGVAFSPSRRLLFAGDLRVTDDGGMDAGPTRHIGAGTQFRAVPWLPLRAGLAAIQLGSGNTGYQLGGGLGVDMGAVTLASSVSLRDTNRFGTETALMVTLIGTGLF